MGRTTLIASLAFALAAGAASASQVVIVREQVAVAGCASLGEVRGKSMLGGALANMAYDRALKSLKKEAERLGATHVLLLDVSAGFAGSNMLGTAYRCEAAKTPAT